MNSMYTPHNLTSASATGWGWGQPLSNVEYVTSLDEALIKTTQPGSDKVYFHQDKDEFYRVRVDFEGRKSYMIFSYTTPTQHESLPASRADLAPLLQRIEALERRMSPDVQEMKVTTTEVSTNG